MYLSRAAHEWTIALQLDRRHGSTEPAGCFGVVRLQSAKDVPGTIAVATARWIDYCPRPKRRDSVDASRRQNKRTLAAECDQNFSWSEVRDCSRGAFSMLNSQFSMLENLTALFQENLACLGQDDFSFGTLEQFEAKFIFQASYHLTKGWLTHAQLARGSGEM